MIRVVALTIVLLGLVAVYLPAVAQSTLQLQLSVYPDLVRDPGLSPNQLIQTGSPSAPTSIFTASAGSAITEDVDYRLSVSGLNSTLTSFTLRQQQLSPAVGSFTDTLTYPGGTTANVNGTFPAPDTATEQWKLWIEQNGQRSNEVYFYWVQKNYARNPSLTAADQYFIKFSPQNASGQGQIETRNTVAVPAVLQVYPNKLYCAQNLKTGTTMISPDASGKIIGFPFTVGLSSFSPNFAAAKTFPLSIRKHLTQTTYSIFLEGSRLSNFASFTAFPPSENNTPTGSAGPSHLLVVGTPHGHTGATVGSPDNNSISCRWELVGQPLGSAATLTNTTNCDGPTYTPDVSGDYVLQLTVADTNGLSSAFQVIESTSAQTSLQCFIGFCYECGQGAQPPLCTIRPASQCQQQGLSCGFQIRE